VKTTSGRRPKVIVSADGNGIVPGAGGLLVTETLRVVGLGGGLAGGLARWRRDRAVRDTGKVIGDLAVAVALGGDCLADIAVLRAEAAALPITGGYVVRPAQPVLLPPPTPTRPAICFPRASVIRRHALAAILRRLPGRGGPPQFPPPPSMRSAPHTPVSPSRLRSRIYTASVAFTPISRGSALPAPARRQDL
jgi:hypothetical protein